MIVTATQLKWTTMEALKWTTKGKHCNFCQCSNNSENMFCQKNEPQRTNLFVSNKSDSDVCIFMMPK